MSIIPSPAQTMPPASVCLDALLRSGYQVEIISPQHGPHQVTADKLVDGRPHHVKVRHADLHQALWFAARQMGDDQLGRYLASLTPEPDAGGDDVGELLTLIRDVLDLPVAELGHGDAYQLLLLKRAGALVGFTRTAAALGDSSLIPFRERVESTRRAIAEQYPVTYPVVEVRRG